MITPSEEQQKVINEWTTTNNNIVIGAVAGSGKTTVLLQLLSNSNQRTLFIAFNKSVQEYIQSKIEELGMRQGKAMTLHAIGLKTIREKYNNVLIKSGKDWEILKEVHRQFETYKKIDYGQIKLLNFTLIEMNNISRMFLTDDIEEIKKQAVKIGSYLMTNVYLEDMWRTFIEVRDSFLEKKVLMIDFLDMIWIPIIKKLTVPIKPTYLLLDEIQDFNQLQHKFIDMFVAQGDIVKWAGVGDKRQAIYGFSGSLSTSFDLFLEKDSVVQLPLSTCYRCPISVIEEANEVYNNLIGFREEKGKVGVTSKISEIKPKSMVICRNTTPLIKLYFDLLGEKKPCYIQGKEILDSLVKFLSPYKEYSINKTCSLLSEKVVELSQDDSENAFLKKYIFEENFDNFTVVADKLCDLTETVESLLNKLKNIFIEDENAIILCTIHKSKGLEADVVYILNENLIPSNFARTEDQLIQEENLRYVARTRAKKEMYYLNL